MHLDLHGSRFDRAGGDDLIGTGLADLARRAETFGPAMERIAAIEPARA